MIVAMMVLVIIGVITTELNEIHCSCGNMDFKKFDQATDISM